MRSMRSRLLNAVAGLMFVAAAILAGCSTQSNQPKTENSSASRPSERVMLPSGGMIVYPKDWPDLSQRREQTVRDASPRDGNDMILLPYGDGLESPRAVERGFRDDAGVTQLDDARRRISRSSLPSTSEEIWVISKPTDKSLAADDTAPRSGALIVQKEKKILPFPLKHTDVKARVDGYIASVDVTQQYQNPFGEKIEAVYVFPLPENAAVNEFVMTIGDRVIRGIIREKEEAQQIYNEAKRQGYTASLLEQNRPNVFTQKVANIEPGKQVDISIRYFHTLAYVDGWYEWTFPMVVGPRFNPPGTTDGIGASARGPGNTSGQKTDVQYLSPAERSGRDISLSVDLNAGVSIEELRSINHNVDATFVAESNRAHANIAILPADSVPNKDFVLRYKVAGKTLKSAVVAQKNDKGEGYFTLMLYPPETTRDLARAPVDLCFTLDVSGSMSGAPIDQSRAAMRSALNSMSPGDTFQVIRFAGSAEQLSDKPLPATKENIRRAMQYVENMEAGGGTMMLDGITRALNQPTADPDRVRYVCMLTDGFIGNEAQLIRATHKLRGNSHVFGFGVGSSPNRYLLDGMSRAGAGAVAYLSLNEDGADVMKPFFERISQPALTNVEIDASGLEGAQITGTRIPDVYVGRAVVVTGKFKGDGGSVIVKGRVNGVGVEHKFDVRPTSTGNSLASVWARQQIASLCDRALYSDDINLDKEVQQIALDYGLLSSFTSFVAVDSTHRSAGEYGKTAIQPVPVPDGVRYDTAVVEK